MTVVERLIDLVRSGARELRAHRLGKDSQGQTNADIVTEINKKNGVSEGDRGAVIDLFMTSGHKALTRLITQYMASMNQDLNSNWHTLKPKRPKVVYGRLPENVDGTVECMGIGGMFAYLNVLYQAYKHGGKHCIVTNPHDIWTFSGWTIHPEEDMDQRLIAMFQTTSMIFHEWRRMLGLSHDPQSLRFKSLKIHYGRTVAMVKNDPKELLKLFKVVFRYVLYEFTDTKNHYARVNLERNAATINALKEMGLVGSDPDHNFIDMCGRVVFEVEGESRVNKKEKLKRQYALDGKKLSSKEVREIYGDRLKILEDMARGKIQAVQYPGGHFLVGFKDNALKASGKKDISVYGNAVATRITIDLEAKKYAVAIRTADGEEKTIVATNLLMALGGYDDDVITVDGISTLFVVRTENKNYRIHPTGMGEGGTIHIVPVWSVEGKEDGKFYYYHLGKATNGAILGRNPQEPKSLGEDKEFLTHLEAHIRRIMPENARLTWIAATECGRPVTAEQGYHVNRVRPYHSVPVQMENETPTSFEAKGGCGLGGNTAIIPEVQTILDQQPGNSNLDR